MTGRNEVGQLGEVEKVGEVEKADDVKKLVGVEVDGDVEIPGDAESRLFPRRPFVGVSIAVIRGDRVLLAARANAPMRGVWTLPGGLVEAGEALAEAALRELQEEVGLSAEVVGVLSPTEIVQRDDDGRVRHHYVVHPHAALWCGGEPEAGPEALGVRWAEPREVPGLETTPGLAETLREAFAMVAARRAAGA